VALADPTPLRFASWVGYDMDGRTDIGWQTCIRYRLEEKAERLASYAALLEQIAPDIAARWPLPGPTARPWPRCLPAT
jgi:phosphoenolpyruvate carboxylase